MSKTKTTAQTEAQEPSYATLQHPLAQHKNLFMGDLLLAFNDSIKTMDVLAQMTQIQPGDMGHDVQGEEFAPVFRTMARYQRTLHDTLEAVFLPMEFRDIQ